MSEDPRLPGAVDLPPNAIAIIGMAGRFPGADTVEQFWRNLCAGVESISHFSEAELEDSFSDEVRKASNFVKARPILTDVDQFDAEFFAMYAREAELTDPQHRLFLECSWQALEDAGYDPAEYRGAVGVFAGCSINTYFLHNVCADRQTVEEFTSSYQVGCYPMLLGAGQDFLATRVSYKLDLKGPSVTVQSACSTSLLTVAQACQSLLLYQSDMALAGGVSVTFPQKRGYQHLEGGMVSADGRCRPFDARATGTVFGSGAGVVLLKRLQDAVDDGDHIYAVIRGSGVNNDGAAKVGFTAPSVEGQAAAIELAHATAGVEARSISYVECHGTATPLGDPIEVAGLTKAFRTSTNDRQFCALGSVKSNIGHLDVAAGVVGLIKTAMSLKHGVLPASLHYEQPNPQIAFAETPFFVNAQHTAWPVGPEPRRAGVSAFGLGGTNVHLVLEEPPPAKRTEQSSLPDYPLIVLSARSAAALEVARSNLAAYVLAKPEVPLTEVAHTLQMGRRAFEHRLSLAGQNREEIIGRLRGEGPAYLRQAKPGRGRGVAFMFPGQGAQYPNMAHDLYRSQPHFKQPMDRCLEILNPMLGEDLRSLLYPAGGSPPAGDRLTSTLAAQPAIFSVEYSLAKLWMSWGVQPHAMIGHSIGEFVAAVLAGVMQLEDALSLVATRGQLMQALPAGAMLAVRLPETELLPLLGSDLAIAAINGPSLCVVSGPHPAIEALERDLQARAATSRRLHTSHAFHSAMVDPVVAPLREHLAHIKLSAPTIPYVSCVSGAWILPEQATSPDYWAQHARLPVRFADGISTLITPEICALLEVGPGNALSSLAHQSLQGRDVAVVTSLQDSARERNDLECVMDALGRLWANGVQPDWRRLYEQAPVRVALPTYPFERKRHWIEPPQRAKLSAAAVNVAEWLSPETESAPTLIVTPNTQEVSAMTQPPLNDRASELRTAIAEILENLSGEAPASTDSTTTFLEMGYDSLFLTQVAQKLQNQFKLKITFRQLLGDYSTIPALARFIAEKLPPAVAQAHTTTPVTTARTAPAMPLQTPSGAGATSAMEAIFREQLQAMTHLMNRQFELLQSTGGEAAGAASAAAGAAARPPAAAAPVLAAAEEPTEQRASRFDVYKPVKKSSESGPVPEHHSHIQDLVRRYTQRTAGSKRLTQEYRPVLADPRAAAGFRAEWKDMVYPIVCQRCAGSKLWDVDGNEYVDLVNGYGQTAFGHAPDFVVKAIKEQLDSGFAIGPQSELAGKVAAAFAEMTGNERVTFCNTGSEAVMAAMRVARTVTGRDKVVIFNGDYHGQFDEVLVKGVQRAGAEPRSMPVAPGIPASSVQNMIVLDYATPATLQWVREHAEELAAVVVEPVQSRHPNLRPFEFLREIRAITEASGTAFVLDEVVTGFRVHPGGIQAVSGIKADLATYGKVVGGGLPIGILAGKAKFMDALDGGQWQFGDDSFPEVGVTFFAGTFVRHPLALAAAWSVLQHLKSHGPALQEQLAQRTAALAAQLSELFTAYGLTAKIETYSSWFYFNVHADHPLAVLLYYHLRLRGVHIQDGFPCFLTTAHSDADIKHIVTAFRESLDELQTAGILGAAVPSAGAATVAGVAAHGASGVPLTESQVEIWLSAQMGDEASCAFNESVTLRMHGTLNHEALRSAFDRIIARHDALRSKFSATGEEISILPELKLEYPLVDLQGRTASESDKALAELLLENARTPFDLVTGPLIRAQLIRLAPDQHAFILTAHHIICDGWSFNVIVNEFAEIYTALCRGETAQLAEPLQFSSYARAQKRVGPAEQAETEAFWLKAFKESVPLLELPTDRSRPEIKSYNGASRCRRIDAALHQAVKKAGARQGNTLFVTLLAAFQALIGRLCDQDEVVVGVPTAGQSLLEDQILVGHCVNFLPIRGRWTRETSIKDHIAAIAKRVMDAYEHQSYTLGTLVRKLALQRNRSRVPLAEIQFNLERLADRLQLPNLNVDVAPNAKAFVNFDLFLNIIESPDGLRIDCDYNVDLFDEATIDRWLDYYQALLAAIAADSAQRLCEAPILPATEIERLLIQVNDTKAEYPRELSIHQLFEAQAAAHPAAPAARYGDTTLSYEELDQRANRLANLILARIGDTPHARERLVGVSVERSLDMLVALLAVLKAGCAYVPLDPTHPANRLRHILNEADVAALISDGSELESLVSANTPVIDLRSAQAAIAAAKPSLSTIASSSDRLAYVIYTSGSTGMPKGVEVTHRAVVNFLTAMARKPGLSRTDTLLAVTTISFDIAGLELFLPLVTGARLVIADREAVADGFRLLQHLEAEGVTVMQATPSSWRLLLEAGFQPKPGFKMLCGGEALPADVASRLAHGPGALWNMYGPTETTIWSSCGLVSAGDATISVGSPIANTQFYVLDRNEQLVPLGVPGQLHIGGDGLARGYYKRPDLTQERFVPNRYGSGRLYRTGDLARWLPDGRLQVVGRIDGQVKLRGFRIELGEIESVLTSQGQLAAAAVALRTDLGTGPRLVGYYVEVPGHSRTPEQLESVLVERLPEYMVPSAWMRLDALPQTPNGKLDRAALPRPQQLQSSPEQYVPATSPVELVLAKIWAEVLHLDRVSTSDDLLRLGADSIQLFQIAARASRADLRITVKQLLQYRSIAALAQFLERNRDADAGSARTDLPSLSQFRRSRRTGSTPNK
jgi:amino acid adenylation domain-containing protein